MKCHLPWVVRGWAKNPDWSSDLGHCESGLEGCATSAVIFGHVGHGSTALGFPVIKQATQELEVSICVDLRWSDWDVGVSGLGEFLGERSDFSEEGATRFREDRAGV